MKRILSICVILIVSGCDGSPESKAKIRSLGKASCALSMNCDPSQYEATGNGWERSNSPTGGAITIGSASLCPLHTSYGFLDKEMKSGMNKICFYK